MVRLPAGYRELQYLENLTGKAYINTHIPSDVLVSYVGYKLESTLKTINMPASAQYIEGSYESGRYYLYASGSISGDVYWQSAFGWQWANSTKIVDNQWHTFVFERSDSLGTVLCDNEEIYSTTASSLNGRSIVLCGSTHQNNTLGTQHKEKKIWYNNELVFHGIPVENSTTTPYTYGLYDLVSGNFFGNEGLDNFTPGPYAETIYKIKKKQYANQILPSDYTRLEYIEGVLNAGSLIDTGFTPNNNSSAEIDFTVTNNSNANAKVLFGTTGSSYADDSFGMYYNVNTYYNHKSDTNVSSYIPGAEIRTIGQRHKIKLHKNTIYYDGNLVYTHTSAPTFTSPSHLFLGKNYGTSDGFIYKCHNAKVWDNDTLIRNMIPAKNSSNIIGMYDLCGRRINMLDGTSPTETGKFIHDNGVITSDTNSAYWRNIPVKPNTTYTISNVATFNGSMRVHGYDSSNSWTRLILKQDVRITDSYTITTSANEYYLGISGYLTSLRDGQIEEGSTATSYEPYDGFYVNVGTGTFSAGSEISRYDKVSIKQSKLVLNNPGYHPIVGYTPLDYIESSGTQHIDTGIEVNASVLTNGLTFEENCTIDLSSSSMADGKNQVPYFFVGKDNTNKFYSGLGSTYKVSSITNDAEFHTLKLDSSAQVFSVDGEIATTYTVTYSDNRAATIYLFNVNSAGGAYSLTGKKKWAKIWSNGQLVRNFISMKRNSDNVLGMYDLAHPFKITEGKTLDSNGNIVDDADSWMCDDFIPVTGNTSITISGAASSSLGITNVIAEYDENKNFIHYYYNYNRNVTTENNTRYIRVSHPKTYLGTYTVKYASSGEVLYKNPFYTNAGTGTFTAGPEVTPYLIKTIKQTNYYLG